jgi:hypothetical protein
VTVLKGTVQAMQPASPALGRDQAPDILAAVAGELGQLAILTARIEAAFGGTVATAVDLRAATSRPARDPEALRDIQRIDLLRQSLEELSLFLGDLADRSTPDAFGDAPLRFPSRLRALEERILHGTQPAPDPSEGDVAML